MPAITTIKNYLSLTKPGMVFGNLIVIAAGFFLASQTHVNAALLASVLAGMALVMASGCVFNNYIDRGMDALMERTKNRVLVRKLISVRNAIVYGILLCLTGISILALYTNLLTAYIALTGFFFYTVIYSIWKRRSSYGAVVGSIAGAVPPVAGYCAANGRFDIGAILLFLILCFWQMPHFFSISLRRLDDYVSASIPVLPLERGVRGTKKAMLLYIILFGVTALLPFTYGYAGYFYLAAVIVSSGAWLALCVKGFRTKNDSAWARAMFIFSLAVLLSLCIAIPIDAFVRAA